jgi:hypothetical protein
VEGKDSTTNYGPFSSFTDRQTSFPIPFDVPDEAGGEVWSFEAEVTDCFGRTGNAKPVQVCIVDDAAPTITVSSVENLWLGTTAINALSAVAGIEVLEKTPATINFKASGTELTQTISPTATSLEWDVPFGVAGSDYNFRFLVTDGKNQTAETYFVLRSVGDSAPYAKLITPSPDQHLVSGCLMVRMRALAIDNVGVKSVDFLADGQVVASVGSEGLAQVGFAEDGTVSPYDQKVDLALEDARSWSAYANFRDDGFVPVVAECDVHIPAGLKQVATGDPTVTVRIGVRVTDKQDNVHYDFENIEIDPDGDSPSVTLVHPDDDVALIEGSLLTLQAFASDNSYVKRVKVYANITLDGNGDYTAGDLVYEDASLPAADHFLGSTNLVDTPPFEVSVKLAPLDDPDRVPYDDFDVDASTEKKQVFWCVEAEDAVNPPTKVYGHYYVVPDNKPIIDLLTPKSDATYPEGAILPLHASASDDVAIDHVVFTVVRLDANGATVETWEHPDNEAPFKCAYQIPSDMGGGSLLASAQAIDTRGSTASEVPIPVQVCSDAPPHIQISEPINGQSLYEGKVLAVTALAGDDIAVSSVTFLVNGEEFVTDTVGSYVTAVDDGVYEMSWSVPYGWAGRTISLGARATDSKGQEKLADQVRVTIVDDDIRPTVEIVEPVNGSGIVEGSVLHVRATAEDNIHVASVSFRLDGDADPFTTDLDAPYEAFLIVPPGAADTISEYVVHVTANDTSGLTSLPRSVTVQVKDDEVPWVEILSPTQPVTDVVEGGRFLLSANADDDVDVVSVEFFLYGENGSRTPLCRDTVLPFSFPRQRRQGLRDQRGGHGHGRAEVRPHLPLHPPLDAGPAAARCGVGPSLPRLPRVRRRDHPARGDGRRRRRRAARRVLREQPHGGLHLQLGFGPRPVRRRHHLPGRVPCPGQRGRQSLRAVRHRLRHPGPVDPVRRDHHRQAPRHDAAGDHALRPGQRRRRHRGRGHQHQRQHGRSERDLLRRVRRRRRARVHRLQRLA